MLGAFWSSSMAISAPRRFTPSGNASAISAPSRNRSRSMGILSLIAWSLFVVVTLKYVIVIMRADNRGEGGILALTALALRSAGARAPAPPLLDPRRRPHRRRVVLRRRRHHPGDLGARARSRASRSRPRSSKRLMSFCLTLVLLFELFLVQRRGTARVGGFFRPHHGPSGSSPSAALAPPGGRAAPRHPARAQSARPGVRLPARSIRRAAASSAWAPSSWRSPASRRSTPIWVISARARSASPGSISSFPPCC